MPISQGKENYCSYTEYNKHNDLINASIIPSSFEDVQVCANFEQHSIKKNDNILNHFKNLKKYLVYYKDGDACNSSKCCSYFNYWLNYYIRNNSNNFGISNFGIYQKFLECDNETKTIDICTPYINLLQEERYEHIKELYDLYEAYNSYKPHKNSPHMSCKFADFFVEKHNKIISKCHDKENIYMCNEIKNVRQLFKQERSTSTQSCDDYPRVLLPIPNLDSVENEQTHLSSHVSIQVFSAVIGIIILCLSLYKFTPLGSLFRNFLNRNKSILNSLEEQNEIQLYNSKGEDVISGDQSYKISYNSEDYS
ncbi:Plasmodium vivax Vir protein, putative [Plasmodium ovale]|uniref:Plasmodium vivax Vir protein, putative n=1 Tax=Plasmodium ovale TaxID=36330 RepID=A0A1C3KJY7_PLAOA|nr:Plasmodium vivax Vir protein, putative [Plasmodium ovale]